MRFENGVLQAALACSLLSTGTLSFSIRGPSRRESPLLLIRKARSNFVEDPEDEEQIHQAWLQSAERFSPEWLQKDIDKSKLPNPDGSVSQVNGGAPGQQAPPIGTTPVNGSTGTVTPATPADKAAASSTGPQMGMVEAAFNRGKQPPAAGGTTPGQKPDDQSVDRFSPQWLQNPPPVPGAPDTGATPNTGATTGQQQQQTSPQGTTTGQQPPQQPQQTAAPPPEDRFSPAWLQTPSEPAHGSNPGMPQDDRFSPDWMRQPFEDGMPPPPDGGPMMMPDDGPLRADHKGAKDWSTPIGGAGQVAAAMGDDFAAFAMNQNGMPPGGMDAPGGMMQPPPGMQQQGGGMLSQGGMMQPPPPGMQQQGGFPDQGGMMQPPQPGITAFPSQPELLPQNPVSEQMAEDMVKQFEESMARLDGKTIPERPAFKEEKKDEGKSREEKKKEPIILPVAETKEEVGKMLPFGDKEDKPAAIKAKDDETKVNQTTVLETTASILDEKNTTEAPRAAKAAAIKQEQAPGNVTTLMKHEEMRRGWDKTPQKREAEQEEKRQRAELKRKYEETLEEVKRTYEEGLRKCTEAKLARFQQLDDEVPKTTDLAVGIARMGQVLRKMKDSDKDKKKLEAELLIWQDQYDRTSEEESKRK